MEPSYSDQRGQAVDLTMAFEVDVARRATLRDGRLGSKQGGRKLELYGLLDGLQVL